MNVILKAINSGCWAALTYILLQGALEVSKKCTTVPEGVDFQSMIKVVTFLVFLIVASTYKVDKRRMQLEQSAENFENALNHIENKLK